MKARFTHDEVAAIQAQAITGDKDARDKLILSFTHYATKKAKQFMQKYSRLIGESSADAEDFQQAAVVGLITSVDSFDPKMSTFTTWAAYNIRNECMDVLRTSMPIVLKRSTWEKKRIPKKYTYAESLDEHCPDSPEPSDRKIQVCQKSEPPEYDDEELELLEKAIASLNQKQQEVIRKYFWDEKTLQEIADEYGVKPQSSYKVKKTSLQKLKKLLPDLDPKQ
jgi:RNA polymerase sigma factor (sigma-70 family)